MSGFVVLGLVFSFTKLSDWLGTICTKLPVFVYFGTLDLDLVNQSSTVTFVKLLLITSCSSPSLGSKRLMYLFLCKIYPRHRLVWVIF